MEPDQRRDQERGLADFKRYLTATPTLLFLLNKEGVIFFMSASAAGYLGPEAEKMIGRKLGEGDLPPGLYQLFTTQNEAVLRTGRREKGEVRYPTIFGEIWFEYAISPVFDGNRIEGTVVTVADITERKRTEEALKRSNADLQQFAYAVSHDLRQPLATISAFLELLRSRYAGKVLDEVAMGYIGYAVDGSKHLAEMTNDLLRYSRVSGNGEEFEPTDMSQALERAKENLAASIHESKAVITNDRLPNLTVAPNQMVQVFQNLLSNAIKYRGKANPRVHVSAELIGDHWQFAVKDNGIGIDPKYSDRLFKMFSRLHTQQEYEGTGIGLALVKRIVERHNGKVWFVSELGKGSTFYFTIPVSLKKVD